MIEVGTQLKKLILDDDFTNIQNLVSEEINLMSILNVSHRELQHSNFLAWLFDPNESHGLGDYFITEFIKLYYRENEYQDLKSYSTLSVFDFVNLKFSDIEIRREHKNIDILIISELNKLCVVIENKIFAREGKGQLKRYRKLISEEYSNYDYRIFIFLSLFEQEISEPERDYYIQLTYDHIVKLITQTLNSQTIILGKNTRFVLEQYIQTLRSIMNENEEIEKIAKDLYRKYKSAFDLVFKYVSPTSTGLVPHNLKRLIENEKTIRPFHTTKTYVRFQPNFLYDKIELLKNKGFLREDDDLINNWLFLFEFRINKDSIFFDMKIGDYEDPSCREKLFELFRNNTSVFNKVARGDRPLSKHWHSSFQKTIVSRAEYNNFLKSEQINLDEIIGKHFKALINSDLPRILKVIESAPK